METKTVFMPRELTAENGAKALLSGEFFEDVRVPCEDCEIYMLDDNEGIECEHCDSTGFATGKVPVSWTTIKAIYAKAVEHLGT